MEEKETTILSFATQKGGSGKSTLTHIVALALGGKALGKKVLIVDTDSQGNLTIAYNRYEKGVKAGTIEKSPAAYDLITTSFENLRNTIKEVNGKYDYILIDVPGTFMATGIKPVYLMCDFVFVPLRHAQPDVDSSKATFKLLEEIKAIREAKQFGFYYSSLISVAEPDKSNFKSVQNYLESQSFPTMKNSFVKYVKFENALNSYENILDIKKWRTEEESFNRLFQEILTHIK